MVSGAAPVPRWVLALRRQRAKCKLIMVQGGAVLFCRRFRCCRLPVALPGGCVPAPHQPKCHAHSYAAHKQQRYIANHDNFQALPAPSLQHKRFALPSIWPTADACALAAPTHTASHPSFDA